MSGDAAAVSIRAVADRVGVTPPSIYLHFGDKDELMWAVCNAQYEEFDRFTQDAAAKATDPLEALKLRGHAYVRFGLDHPEEYRILFMAKPTAMPQSSDPDELQKLMGFQHLVLNVQSCMERGEIASGDVLTTSLVLWFAVHGITSLLIAKPDFPWPDVEHLVDQAIAATFEGLRNHPLSAP